MQPVLFERWIQERSSRPIKYTDPLSDPSYQSAAGLQRLLLSAAGQSRSQGIACRSGLTVALLSWIGGITLVVPREIGVGDRYAKIQTLNLVPPADRYEESISWLENELVKADLC